MRWSQLFADLESQADALAAAELDGEVAERTRIETGRLTLVDRLRAAHGHPVELRCAGVGRLAGRLDRIGPDWLLVAERAGSEILVPFRSVLSVVGLGRRSVLPGPAAVALGLRSVLRGVARDRAPVRVVLSDGVPVDGTVDRVGADYLEVAEHPAGEPRRAGAVIRVRTVPFSGLGAVRRW